MADYYRIETSNQTVTGTAAGEVFEFVSSSTNNTFTNVVINAAGGQDTIKATHDQNVDATITGLDSSSVLDFGRYYNYTYYYAKQDDGIYISDLSGNFKVKLLGATDTSICSKETVSKFMERQQESPWDGWVTNGTNLADTISVNHSNCFVYSAHAGDDLILTAKNNNTLRGAGGNDVFICGGTNNTIDGGNGNNEYIISTGLVSVEAANAETTLYDPFTSDAVNVTITDAKAGDSYYLRDYGIDGLNMSTTSDGVVISSKGGQINITMKNCDWNSVKNNLISLDNAQGSVKTYTLEQAVGVGATPSTTPTGVSVAGRFLNISSDFVGNVIMSSSAANYTNNQIGIIDATKNGQAGMQLGGNSNSNAIYAGSGGNTLWGGEDRVSDYLFGGAGADIFLVGKNDGNDAVYNAGNNDTINLYDVTLDDVRDYSYDKNANTIALGLSSGNYISVELTNDSNFWSAKFQLADDSAYRYDYLSGSWQSA